MEKKEPIQYTIENKNGVHEYSDSFEINDWVRIRIIILHPVAERNLLTSIVKKISCQDVDIPFDNSSTDYSGNCSTINHLRYDVLLKNTSDLKFELIENAKIKVMLLFNYNESCYDYCSPPTIKSNDNITTQYVRKLKFEVENINGEIKFNPEKLNVGLNIGLVRVTSSDEKTNNEFIFKHNNTEYNNTRVLSAYGLPNYISEFMLYTDGRFGSLINNISEFNFTKVPPNIKLTVEMFEHIPIKPRKLFNGDIEIQNRNATELKVKLFGENKKEDEK